VPRVKATIRELDLGRCAALAQEALTLAGADDVAQARARHGVGDQRLIADVAVCLLVAGRGVDAPCVPVRGEDADDDCRDRDHAGSDQERPLMPLTNA
jgi:hypothetical protein